MSQTLDALMETRVSEIVRLSNSPAFSMLTRSEQDALIQELNGLRNALTGRRQLREFQSKHVA